MAEKDSQSDPKEQKLERKFSQEQYDLLKRCSATNDMTKWNEWRKIHEKDDICLEGCEFVKWYLKSVKFGFNQMLYKDTGDKFYGEVYLNGADFQCADLRDADIQFAHLNGAKLSWAHLQGAALMNARLNGAKLWFARLQGADASFADLRGAELIQAKVDGNTTLWRCQVDRKTNAEGVALDRAVIEPCNKQLLEYNIRRKNWEQWYPKQHWSLRWMVREFWEISDYGRSTKQIVYTFFQLAVIFAGIYLAWGLVDYYLLGIKDYPGIVSDLFVLENEQEVVSRSLVPFRAVYFSVVTMTTLGFGDMYANAHSLVRGLFGHVLLALQVILGYVLLAALVTRFAVLFTAGGPAGKFAEKEHKRASPES